MPLTEASRDGDDLRLPFAGDHIRDAPNLDPDVQLEPDEEQRLARHYDLGGDDAMTRSEEEVSFSKRRRPRERIRIKK